jgi:hypothetical protein
MQFPKFQHAVCLKDSEKVSECFACNKCYWVFQLKYEYNNYYREYDGKIKEKQQQVLRDEKIINPYFIQNPVAKYLYCTDQLELFRQIQYYISKDDE